MLDNYRGIRSAIAPANSQLESSERKPERDRYELEIRRIPTAAEHDVVSCFEEGVDAAEREAQSASTIQADRVGAAEERIAATIVDPQSSNEVRGVTLRTEIEDRVHRSGNDVDGGIPSLRPQAVVAALQSHAYGERRYPDVQPRRQVVSQIGDIPEPADGRRHPAHEKGVHLSLGHRRQV